MSSVRKPYGSIALISIPALVFAITCTASGCAGKVGTTARSMLSRVRNDSDPNTRYEAYAKLGKRRTYDDDKQVAEAVAELSSRLAGDKEPAITRAVICRSLGELKRPEARPSLIKALEDEDGDVRTEAARALGKIGHDEDAVLLARMMAIDTTHNGRVAAAEGLAKMKPKDPRVLISLSESLTNDDPAIRLSAYRALKEITGADPGTDVDSWQEYLAANIPGINGQQPAPTPRAANQLAAAPGQTVAPMQQPVIPSDAALRPIGFTPGESVSLPPGLPDAPPGAAGGNGP